MIVLTWKVGIYIFGFRGI